MRGMESQPVGADGRRPSEVIVAYLAGMEDIERRYVPAIDAALRHPVGDGSLPEEFVRLDQAVLAAVSQVRDGTCTQAARVRAALRPLLTEPPSHDPNSLAVLAVHAARDRSIRIETAEGELQTRHRYRLVLDAGSWRIDDRTMHPGPGHRARSSL